jgi:hypothetical protein
MTCGARINAADEDGSVQPHMPKLSTVSCLLPAEAALVGRSDPSA